jgi:hypothetical protein
VATFDALEAAIKNFTSITVTANITFKHFIPIDYSAGGGKGVTIMGANGNEVLDGNGTTQHFRVSGGGKLHLERLTLTHGVDTSWDNADGGSVSFTGGGSGSITDCTMISNLAVFGGAVRLDSTGSATISGTRFEGNKATCAFNDGQWCGRGNDILCGECDLTCPYSPPSKCPSGTSGKCTLMTPDEVTGYTDYDVHTCYSCSCELSHSPTLTPTPSGCPGGSASACMALCPSTPPGLYKNCVADCVSRCTSEVEALPA